MNIEIQICKMRTSRALFYNNVNILILMKGTLKSCFGDQFYVVFYYNKNVV